MSAKKLQTIIQNLLDPIDVKINGDRPWDIQIHNPNFYSRILANGSLALGESYMDGWWDSPFLDQLITKFLLGNLDEKVINSKQIFWQGIKARLINQQNKKRAQVVGRQHYDVGNELYQNMLDKKMNYSCGYWKEAKNLDEAQEAKLNLICKKLKLEPGMTLLDIGCGWGSLAKFASENYKVKVVGVTISKEQFKLATERCKDLPIEIRLQDYRDINEKFDRIISIGMFEHVGYKNYSTYFKTVNKCLKDNGLFLLHTIAGNKSVTNTDPWIAKYIFPNSMLPSAKQITTNSEGLFILEDWHNFGLDYDKTLMAWYNNFNATWNKIKNDYDERFYRMWHYYILTSAATFRSRKSQLWQIVFSKIDSQINYQSVR